MARWAMVFGASVSISGDTVVVGAPETPYNDTVAGPGAAYVFSEPGPVWANMAQTAELTASDGAAGDGFGVSVSISGNTVAVGAPGSPDDPGTYYSGTDNGPEAAYVFTEPGSGWATMTQTAELTASDGAAEDLFGVSVSISGNTVAVGAPRTPFNLGTYTPGAGVAYVFTEPGSGWANTTQTGELTASDGAAGSDEWGGDAFGVSVSISGNTVVAGAANAMIGENGGQGAAYVFAARASWTFMVYMDGQLPPPHTPDLEDYAITNFLQMSSVGSVSSAGSQPGVNIVVELGRDGMDPDYGGWTGIKEGLVAKGDDPNSEWGSPVTETDMSSYVTLENFVTWAARSFPAANYALVLWDHGGWIPRRVRECSRQSDYARPAFDGAVQRHFTQTIADRIRRLPHGDDRGRVPDAHVCERAGGLRVV